MRTSQGASRGDRRQRCQLPAARVERFCLSHGGRRTILLISADEPFHEELRSTANALGLMVIRAERVPGATAILQATKPVSVILDLDLPQEGAWETAELLLKEPTCPAVILVTGRTGQFDMQTAIRAGSLLSKNESPGHLLEIVQQALEMPEANQLERNTIQLVLIRWLKPSGWIEAESATSAYRFWGINE